MVTRHPSVRFVVLLLIITFCLSGCHVSGKSHESNDSSSSGDIQDTDSGNDSSKSTRSETSPESLSEAELVSADSEADVSMNADTMFAKTDLSNLDSTANASISNSTRSGFKTEKINNAMASLMGTSWGLAKLTIASYEAALIALDMSAYLLLGIVLTFFAAGWPGVIYFLSTFAFLWRFGKDLPLLFTQSPVLGFYFALAGFIIGVSGFCVGIWMLVRFSRGKILPDKTNLSLLAPLIAVSVTSSLGAVFETVDLVRNFQASTASTSSWMVLLPSFVYLPMLVVSAALLIPVVQHYPRSSAITGAVILGYWSFAKVVEDAVILSLLFSPGASNDHTRTAHNTWIVAGVLWVFFASMSVVGFLVQRRRTNPGMLYWTGRGPLALPKDPYYGTHAMTIPLSPELSVTGAAFNDPATYAQVVPGHDGKNQEFWSGIKS